VEALVFASIATAFCVYSMSLLTYLNSEERLSAQHWAFPLPRESDLLPSMHDSLHSIQSRITRPDYDGQLPQGKFYHCCRPRSIAAGSVATAVVSGEIGADCEFCSRVFSTIVELVWALSLVRTAALGGPTRRFRPESYAFESV
jgi:hypothetical protein